VGSNRIAYTDSRQLDFSNQEYHALLVQGTGQIGGARIGSALIMGNMFSGFGLPHLIEVLGGFEKVLFNNNYCDHGVREVRDGVATVSLMSQDIIVMGNHIKSSPSRIPSIDFDTPQHLTFIGNIVTDGFLNLPIFVPAPMLPLNVQV
jgi:hypothetical protein